MAASTMLVKRFLLVYDAARTHFLEGEGYRVLRVAGLVHHVASVFHQASSLDAVLTGRSRGDEQGPDSLSPLSRGEVG